MFHIADTSKLMNTITLGAITMTNAIVQWPFVVAYRASLSR
jgi:hypothetical protein